MAHGIALVPMTLSNPQGHLPFQMHFFRTVMQHLQDINLCGTL